MSSSYALSAAVNDNEKHTDDITTLLFHKGSIYSGANDGKIKVWTRDLKLIKEIDAHPVNVYSLAANEKYLFSSSNDGTIKCWDISSYAPVQNLQECPNDEVTKLFYSISTDKLFSGDDKGAVKVWQNEKLTDQYNVMEEIEGLLVKENILYTAGNMDITITEMKPGHKSQYVTRQIFDGRGPMCLVDNFVAYIKRDGRTISLINSEAPFKIVSELPSHEMIVNALCGAVNGQGILCSGGYDNQVKIWNLKEKKNISNYSVGKCVNALLTVENEIYIGTLNGYIERISLK